MWGGLRVWPAAMLVLVALPAAAQKRIPPQAIIGTIAVVVHAQSSVTNLSSAHLRRVFAGEQLSWDSGDRITLLLPQKGTPDRGLALRAVYRMNEREFTRFWISKTFGDQVAVAPTLMPSAAATLKSLQSMAGGIGVVAWPFQDAMVRAVSIDGKRPGEAGYALHIQP